MQKKPSSDRFARVLTALCLVAPMIVAGPAIGQCRSAVSSPVPMPEAVWLRSWEAGLAAPARLAADSGGLLLISDPQRGRIVARHADGAPAFVRSLPGKPTALAVDGRGSHFVGDAATGSVTVYDRDWQPRHALGVGAGEFGLPGDIAVAADSGEIFVADTARHVVRVYAPSGLPLRVIGAPAPADGLPAANGSFRTPTGLFIDGDELLVADQLNYRIQAFDRRSGAFRYCLGSHRESGFFGPAGGPSRTFGMAQGLWVDARGRLYVADGFKGVVQVIDRDNGAVIGTLGHFGDGAGALGVPSDLLIDAHGRLFVANTAAGRIEIFGLDAYADPERYVPARARLSVSELSRPAPPAVVGAAIAVPGHRVLDIDPETVRVNGLPASALAIEDEDGDGAPELRVAVAGAALLATLDEGADRAVTVSGRIGALELLATTSVTVLAAPPAGDGDGDGVPDSLDACPGSAAGEAADTAGCTVVQRCPCAGPAGGWRNHGAYVSCVAAAAGVLRALGRLDDEAGVVRQAARSDCGRAR
jgi:DNA-binding beta-propeller fold protein YncE